MIANIAPLLVLFKTLVWSLLTDVEIKCGKVCVPETLARFEPLDIYEYTVYAFECFHGLPFSLTLLLGSSCRPA